MVEKIQLGRGTVLKQVNDALGPWCCMRRTENAVSLFTRVLGRVCGLPEESGERGGTKARTTVSEHLTAGHHETMLEEGLHVSHLILL